MPFKPLAETAREKRKKSGKWGGNVNLHWRALFLFTRAVVPPHELRLFPCLFLSSAVASTSPSAVSEQ